MFMDQLVHIVNYMDSILNNFDLYYMNQYDLFVQGQYS